MSFFFAPKKGVIFRQLKIRRFKNKILEENILKLLYQLGEEQKDFFVKRTKKDILGLRQLEVQQLNRGLNTLVAHRYLTKENQFYFLTKEGKRKGQRTLKLHRLWELYLTEYLNIAPDHVHEDAESIEHVITPEIEAKLEKVLNYPKLDPHQSEIPYEK